MQYDNEHLCEILNDKAQTLEMAAAFLKRMEKEMAGWKDQALASIYREASELHVKRQIQIVWDAAESPVERIFICSLMMNFIRNHDPLGLVITRPMADAERNTEELRESIRRLQAAIGTRESRGGNMSPAAVFDDLMQAYESGQLDDWQYDLNLHMIWCYHLFDLEAALHLTPQATFPKLLPGGRAVRSDLLCWIPEHPDFRIIVECDSYKHHDSRQAFDYDRRRSRALQRKGFRVLQYSGGEIYRDPIRVSFDLYSHLTDELKRFDGAGHNGG